MSQVVTIEDSLYEKVVLLVAQDPIKFPTIKNFIDKAVQKELENLKLEASKEKINQ